MSKHTQNLIRLALLVLVTSITLVSAQTVLAAPVGGYPGPEVGYANVRIVCAQSGDYARNTYVTLQGMNHTAYQFQTNDFGFFVEEVVPNTYWVIIGREVVAITKFDSAGTPQTFTYSKC